MNIACNGWIGICTESICLLTVTYPDKIDHILDEIIRATELHKTGMGIAFIVPVEKVVGIAHSICETPR